MNIYIYIYIHTHHEFVYICLRAWSPVPARCDLLKSALAILARRISRRHRLSVDLCGSLKLKDRSLEIANTLVKLVLLSA